MRIPNKIILILLVLAHLAKKRNFLIINLELASILGEILKFKKLSTFITKH
jgi:hypothetical protein